MEKSHIPREGNESLYNLVDEANALVKRYEKQMDRYKKFVESAQGASAHKFAKFIQGIYPSTDQLATDILKKSNELFKAFSSPRFRITTISPEEDEHDNRMWFLHLSMVLSAHITMLRSTLDMLGSAHKQIVEKKDLLFQMEDTDAKHQTQIEDLEAKHQARMRSGKIALRFAMAAFFVSLIVSGAMYLFPRGAITPSSTKITKIVIKVQ